MRQEKKPMPGLPALTRYLRVVVTVIVEEAGSGGAVAGPIARTLFDLYMSRG